MTSHLLETMHELDSRKADGIHVRLLWRRHDGRVAVVVNNHRTGDDFAVDVRQGERAFDVFHHPYAYAAWRGIETRTPQPA